ncbi:MAG: AI-2E family transporter [Bacteroidia bacterium]|nr:AI-2E family transporter [Bacteroidia bacterium]
MKRGTRIALIVAPIVLVALAFYFFSNIISYLCISAVLSLMGRPLMDQMMKIRVKNIKMPASVAAVISLATLIGTFVLLFSLFLPTLAQQTVKLQSSVNLDDVEQGLAEPIASTERLIHTYQLAPDDFQLVPYLQNVITEFLSSIQISSIASQLVGFTGDLFIGIFSIAFITFFLLKERSILRNMIQALIPDEYEAKVDHILVTIRDLLTRYFIGVMVEVVLVGTLISIGLGILGVDNAVVIGFFAGLFNVIPYVGPIIGAAIGLAFTVIGSLELDFYSQTLPLLGKVAGVFAVVQLADNFIFQPFIYSSSVKAHPLEIFIVILMGANLAGIGGMILAIPVYTILRVIAGEFFSQFEVVRSITGRM